MALFKILKGSGNLPTTKTEGWAYVKKINNEAAEFYVDYDANTRLQVGKQYNVVSATEDGIVPKFDAADGRIDSNSSDWVLTNNNGSLGWYRLPTNAFKNDNTNTTYTLSGAADGNTWVTTLTGSDSATTTSTVPAASTTAAGLMTPAMVEKLNGIAAGATANKGDITQVTAGDGLTGGAASGNATLSANLGLGLVFDSEKKIAANTSYTSANKNYAVKTDSNGALYVNVPWSDTDTHHTTRIYTGASGATANATSSVSNPYITVTDNNVYRTQVQLKGDGATSISADDGVITISSTNTTYSAFKGASASANGGAGLVPAPAKGQEGYYLRGDGVWFNLTGLDESVQNTFGALQKAWKEADSSLKDTLTTLINGKAQTNHASSGTSYGISTASLYGHAMASSTTPKASAATAAVGSETAKFARGDHVHPLTVANSWSGGVTAGPKLKTTINGVAGTAISIPTASASASGAVIVGDQTFGGIKRFSQVDINATYHLGSFYNYGNGCLIDIGPAKSSTMVAIHITGNSYSSSDAPINSLYQVYDYGSGTTMNYSGISIGQDLGAMKVYRYNDRLYAHIVQKTSYSTLNITLYTNKTGLTPTVTNAVAQATGYTDLVTITPSRPPLAASGVTAGTYGLDGTATPAFGGSFIVPKVTVDAYGRITAANEYNVTIPNSTASQTAAGLMSADDKKKLDGIATGANKITVDSALSTTSTNPVQNKIVTTAINGKADLSEGAIFVQGSGTTDSTAKTSTWLGTSSKITAYYDGLTIRYKIGVAGQSTTTLNINNLGAKTVYRFSDSKLTTHFPVNSIIHLIYHADLNGGCWMCSDYDANTNTYQRLYPTTSNVEYPITTRYNTTSGASYYAEYGRYSTGVTLNPSTNTITAAHFKGLASNATADAQGNTITSTYATITNLNKKLDKLTYEWNKEYSAGGTAGYLLIGSFPMYDTNVTIDIDATTNTTYHGTVVIATQNVSTTSIGSAHTITVYGDPTGAISNAIRVVWTSGSRNYNVYFVPSTWSKNLIHIRAIGQYMDTIDESKICTQFTAGTVPTTTTGLTVVNALTSNFNNYVHPTTAGNKHIPAGGSSGQILRWSADGTAAWGADNNTDTKVTAVENHYTPTANTASELTVDASSTTAATWNSTSLVTGVNIQRDAKGHVVGITVDSIKMPANPNTDTNYYHTPSYGSAPSAATTGGSSTNIKIGTSNNSAKLADLYVPTATGSTPGVTIVYPAASCTTFSSDSGTCTPKAVQKSVNLFTADGDSVVGTIKVTNQNNGWTTRKIYGFTSDNTAGWIVSRDTNGGFNAGYIANGSNYIAFPADGQAKFSGTQTGYLCIAMPTAAYKNQCMNKFKVSVYNYDEGASVDYIISGYTYNDGTWYNCSAICLGQKGGALSNLPVHFAYDSTRMYVYIGNNNTSWSYPNINISDITVGHSGLISQLKSGWGISFSTTTKTIHKTISNTFVAHTAYNADYSTTAGALTNDGTCILYSGWSNEINFGGSANSDRIYFGYRACDSKPIPTHFVFGGSNGTASLQANTIYLGSGTTSYISATQYTGNSATASSSPKLTTSGSLTSSNIDGFLEAGVVKWGTGDSTAVGNNDGIVMSFGWSDGYGAQMWLDDGSGEGGMKIRNRTGGTAWNPWRQVLTENNYTDYAAPASHTHSYLPLSGGTLTGDLTFAAGKNINMTYSGSKVVLCNHNNGNVSLSALGSGLYIGYQNTTSIVFGANGAWGTMTSSGLSMPADTQISNADTGGSWISGRTNAAVRMTASTSGSSFAPVVSSKTQLGSWDLGPCHPNEHFYFSYATDTNYNAGTNSTMTAIYFEKEGNIRANKVYGAVWNDYAEYRQTNVSEPGRVVIENNDDTLSLATERLMPGANIISDTFGFAIGETKNAKTPLAVSGRVLAYTWEPREAFQAGDAVCSGPKGTVSKMTREEIMMYPERIIGTVSAVPTYETWGPNEIQVNGRIWIKVK